MNDEAQVVETTLPETLLLLYIGHCLLSDNKEGSSFLRITEEEFDKSTLLEERLLCFYLDKKTIKRISARPGMVYEVPSPSPGMILPYKAKYRGVWKDLEQRAKWEATDFAVSVEIALQRKAAKAKNDNAILKCLEPIRKAWLNARGLQRNLILAQAVQYITKL